MIVRELKLKLNRSQERQLYEWLPVLTAIYNWAIRKLEQDAKDSIYYSRIEFQNLLSNHGKRIDVASHVIQGILYQAWIAWKRYRKGVSNKPRLKSVRNKLNSIPFPDPIPESNIKNNRIRLWGIGNLKYHKQELPKGKIKTSRIVRRASGWYVQLTIDAKHLFLVKDTQEAIGIDTGFKHLAVLSNGIKYENQKNYLKSQERLGQAQRGHDRKLIGRLNERISNKRRDYNHKVSKEIIHNYRTIYITNDSLAGQAAMFGKAVNDAGIVQLRRFILYKGNNHGRNVILVESNYTTMTCSVCGARSGPTGLSKLAVRSWECGCGAVHDRDVNAAMNILNFGAGVALVSDRRINSISDSNRKSHGVSSREAQWFLKDSAVMTMTQFNTVENIDVEAVV